MNIHKHITSFYKKYTKRFLDFIFSFFLIILLSPLLILIAIIVKINLGSPVIFRQKRPGLHGKIFTLYKFRSMTNDKDKMNKYLSDESRLTKFGIWFRSTSLDELPELFNILKGDMSFVGPRPLLVEYLSLYNSRQFKRHNVKPGLTGYAQINGRNSISWNEKFNLDLYYVENISLKLDLNIIISTFKIVFTRKGINHSGSTTMEPFNGNEDNLNE